MLLNIPIHMLSKEFSPDFIVYLVRWLEYQCFTPRLLLLEIKSTMKHFGKYFTTGIENSSEFSGSFQLENLVKWYFPTLLSLINHLPNALLLLTEGMTCYAIFQIQAYT